MRRAVLTSVSTLAALLGLAGPLGCDGQGTFTPDPGGDAGPLNPGGVSIDDIGQPCTYDPSDPAHPNPSNQCARGLQCIIVTSDNQYRYDDGAGLPVWEDQFTVYTDSGDVGYCTLKGTVAAPPTCPAGSELKVLTQDVTICVKTCSQPGQCGRTDYTCDVRYADTPDPLCVHKCSFDVPDCVRSGVFQFAQDPQGTLRPALFLDDLAGDATCDTSAGICGGLDPSQKGAAAPGETCNSSADCEVGSACLQGPVVWAALGRPAFLDPNGPGFCASPCNPAADPSQQQPGSCTDAFVCQSVGNLNLGFRDPAHGVPGPFVVDSQGNLDVRGGFCFHQCAEGVQGNCDAFPGTKCSSLNESLVVDTWNQQPMCLPTPIAN